MKAIHKSDWIRALTCSVLRLDPDKSSLQPTLALALFALLTLPTLDEGVDAIVDMTSAAPWESDTGKIN